MDGYRTSQARRTQLITALKANERNSFTDEQLAAFSTEYLTRLADLAAIPAVVPTFAPTNYALRGVPQPEPVAEETIEGPPSLVDNIRTAAGKPELVSGFKK